MLHTTEISILAFVLLLALFAFKEDLIESYSWENQTVKAMKMANECREFNSLDKLPSKSLSEKTSDELRELKEFYHNDLKNCRGDNTSNFWG